MRNVLLFLAIFGVLCSCHPKQEPVAIQQPIAVKEPVSVKQPEPQIISISFPSIPDKDVTIDQVNRIIYVKVAALLNVDNLEPTVVLSEGASLTSSQDHIGNLRNWCTGGDLTIGIFRRDKSPEVTFYRIRPIAFAPLAINDSKPFPVLVLGELGELNVGIQNLYGNWLPQSVVFTNKKTGAELVLDQGIYGSLFINTLTINVRPVSFGLGEYYIKLQLRDGSSLKIPQTLTIVQGPSVIDEYFLNTLAGQKLAVRGRNLFEGSITFQLRYPNKTTIPLSVVAYNLSGKTATIEIPNSVEPGYYAIEMLKNGLPLGLSYRLSIKREEKQLFIESFNHWPSNGSPINTPMILTRDTPIEVNFNYTFRIDGYYVGRYVIVLTDESNTTPVFRFPINLPLEAYCYFRISASTPTGRYKATIQEVNPITNEVSRMSEPFEQTIILE